MKIFTNLCEDYNDLFPKNKKHKDDDCNRCQEVLDAWNSILKTLIPPEIMRLRKLKK